MTYQVEDWLYYSGDKYELLRDTSRQLPFLKNFGIEIGVVDTACSRGYMAEYAIVNETLYLENLLVSSVNDFYPEIDGVKPTDEGKYLGLNLLMPINGTVVIGTDMPEDWLPADMRSVHDYRKVLMLYVACGIVQQVIDISEQAAEIRVEMQSIFTERLANPNWSPLNGDQHSERLKQLQGTSWALKNDKKIVG